MTFGPALADRSRWSTERCSIAAVLDVLNTRAAFLVIRECFYGTTRFDDFVDRVGMSAPAVSRALKRLEDAGVVAGSPYREPGARTRTEYVLTPAGEELLPLLIALAQWGDAHLRDGRGPLSYTEIASGRAVRAVVTTDDADDAIPADAILVEPGPGSRR
ncbi:helix-turn-helix domain-containing protein [uncultured Williamsia sp.]|uniref:winged helix-turn-helix transcriptional regulator n=1 Tax=uncultured Williamsia sp. TaxID=259311 RepID=UPI00261CF1E0|nr:helix-turn-helix domain-containing protein [uncultured Williamsia sp.]